MRRKYIAQNQSADGLGTGVQVRPFKGGEGENVTFEAVQLDLSGNFGGGTVKVKVSALGDLESPINWLNASNPDGAAITSPDITSACSIIVRVPSGAWINTELSGATSPDLTVLAAGQLAR